MKKYILLALLLALAFTFYGFYKHPYRVTVCIDNTRLTLTVDPTK